MDDALSELFLDQTSLERLLVIWTGKKNLILQGAPGVGKSFVAKRLAYLLLGAKALAVWRLTFSGFLFTLLGSFL
jgi:predicted ATPase with chaperone activity